MTITPRRIDELSAEELRTLLHRSTDDVRQVFDYIRDIVEDVRVNGDAPVLAEHARLKADITTADLIATPEEVAAAYEEVGDEVVAALKKAARNILTFHRAQLERQMWSMEIQPGVTLGRMTNAIPTAGCYAPGGTAMYPSSVLMTVLPAKAAGVDRIIVASPPREGMLGNPATLVAADIAGADMVVKVGGPWAVAALAYGTDTIPAADKIVGPGNKYVTAAKLVVFGQVDIDSPAGPSEALILADATANPAHMALDFLSQVEHDADSGAVLVTDSPDLARAVCAEIENLVPGLDRRQMIDSALARHSSVLVARDMDQAVEFTNSYAAEHLQIVTADPWGLLPRIRHAGSIFMGPYAPVPVGDYTSGTNHVLPTGRMARTFSGLSVDDFLKRPTFQYLTKEGLAGLKDTVTTLAKAEGLPLHARSVQARFEE